MFRLTHKEQVTVFCLLFAFLLGLGVKHYREKASVRKILEIQANK